MRVGEIMFPSQAEQASPGRGPANVRAATQAVRGPDHVGTRQSWLDRTYADLIADGGLALARCDQRRTGLQGPGHDPLIAIDRGHEHLGEDLSKSF